MQNPKELSGARQGGFLTDATRNLMNPNFGRTGMPQLDPLSIFPERTEREVHLAGVASIVFASFIASPTDITRESGEMSQSLIDFLAIYPHQGFITTKRGITSPLDAKSYEIGMQLAHRIYREAGILPEITAKDLEIIRLRERASTISGLSNLSVVFEQAWQILSVEGLTLLDDEVKKLTKGLPVQQGKSVEQAFRHLGSILGRKQKNSSSNL